MKNFDGKVAAITGAGSGIGRALACELAKRGATVALADKDTSGMAETKRLIEATGRRCSMHELDVADRAAVEQYAADVVEAHGSVQLLFNNAGVTLVDRVESLDIADFEWLMNINFWGVVYGTKAFLPHLLQADEAHIINISSVFGIIGVPVQSTYNAAKFAVRGFTESLKMELARTNVGVSCVHPGGIKTEIARNARIGNLSGDVTSDEVAANFDEMARTTPEKAARTILKGVRRNRRRILIGFDARIMDWAARLFPGSYEKLLRLESDERLKLSGDSE